MQGRLESSTLVMKSPRETTPAQLRYETLVRKEPSHSALDQRSMVLEISLVGERIQLRFTEMMESESMKKLSV